MATNSSESLIMNAVQLSAIAAASLLGMGCAYLAQNQRLQDVQRESELRIKEEKRRSRKMLRNTAEYKARMERFLIRKREYEQGLTSVAYFDENDEMIVKKINIGEGALPKGCLLMEERPTVYKVTKDLTGEKFIQNIENINKERVLQKPPMPQKQGEELAEAHIDLNPKKLKQPKDVVFMDFMAMYSRALKKESKLNAN